MLAASGPSQAPPTNWRWQEDPAPWAVLGRQGWVGAEAGLGCDGGMAFQVFPGACCPLRSWRAPLQDRGAGHTHTSSLNLRRAPQCRALSPGLLGCGGGAPLWLDGGKRPVRLAC